MNFLSSCSQEVEQPSEATNEGSHIGIGSGVEGLGHARELVLVDDTKAYELRFGTLTGVELHREGNELEHGEHKINRYAGVNGDRAKT